MASQCVITSEELVHRSFTILLETLELEKGKWPAPAERGRWRSRVPGLEYESAVVRDRQQALVAALGAINGFLHNRQHGLADKSIEELAEGARREGL